MADELILHNFIASDDIKAGQFVAATGLASDGITPVCAPADTTNVSIIGISLKDVNAGEAATYHNIFAGGSTCKIIAGAAISAGDQLGVNASGLAETAGSGNVAVPVFAQEAAAAANDVILAVIAFPGVVGS